MTALVLTADELRVAARAFGATAPAALNAEWAAEDIAVADVVALRGLLARGLAATRSGEVVLTAALFAALRPLLQADLLIEVIRDATTSARRWLIAQAAGGTVVAEERDPDVWQLRRADAPARRLAAAIVAELIAELPAASAPATPQVVAVPTAALVAAERQRWRGTAYAVAELTGAGLADADATTVGNLLGDVNAFVTVRLAAHEHESWTADAVTWFETGAAGSWLATVEQPADLTDDPATDRDQPQLDDLPYPDELDRITQLRAVTATEIQAATQALLGTELDPAGATERGEP